MDNWICIDAEQKPKSGEDIYLLFDNGETRRLLGDHFNMPFACITHWKPIEHTTEETNAWDNTMDN